MDAYYTKSKGMSQSASIAVEAHPDTAITLDMFGDILRPYFKTYQYPGDFIDAHHAAYEDKSLQDLEAYEDTRGWLLREDALKLYELAYFSEGNILELGTYQGLSTGIMAKALRESESAHTITTIELDPAQQDVAKQHLTLYGLRKYVEYHTGDAKEILQDFMQEKKTFSVAFIDHSHTYEDVQTTCKQLSSLLTPGGFCLFHDYTDPNNADPNNDDYGVFQAIEDHLPKDTFTLYGVVGCCGLFRKN